MMAATMHELATSNYGNGMPTALPLCANCDCCLSDRLQIATVDAPEELFCRQCVIQCKSCSRFMHYTVSIPNAVWLHGKAAGTCVECGDPAVPISVIQMEF